MLKKKYVKSRKTSKITFEIADYELPGNIEASSVHLVGAFNHWDPKATPMRYLKRGVFQATLELEPGHEYQFRYLINGEHWCNDSEADSYIPNEYGAENCVVKTPNKI